MTQEEVDYVLRHWKSAVGKLIYYNELLRLPLSSLKFLSHLKEVIDGDFNDISRI